MISECYDDSITELDKLFKGESQDLNLELDEDYYLTLKITLTYADAQGCDEIAAKIRAVLASRKFDIDSPGIDRAIHFVLILFESMSKEKKEFMELFDFLDPIQAFINLLQCRSDDHPHKAIIDDICNTAKMIWAKQVPN